MRPAFLLLCIATTVVGCGTVGLNESNIDGYDVTKLRYFKNSQGTCEVISDSGKFFPVACSRVGL